MNTTVDIDSSGISAFYHNFFSSDPISWALLIYAVLAVLALCLFPKERN